jgi:hypothetical protein
MQSGWKLEGNENNISLRKHNKKLSFNIKIETSRGVLFVVRIENGQELMTATVNIKFETKKVDINEAHALYGHLSIKITQNISKTIGWELTGEPDRCEHCAIARGWQMNVKKKTDHVTLKKVGERLFLDVAAVMQNQNSDASVDSTSKRYRRIMVNEASQFMISDFFIYKHVIIDEMCE